VCYVAVLPLYLKAVRTVLFSQLSLSVGSGLALSMSHGVGAALGSVGPERSWRGPAEVSRATAHVAPVVNRVSVASF